METGSSSYVRRARLSIECLPRGWRTEDDTELEQALAVRFGIQSIPSLILVEKGQQIARTAGAMPETALLQWIESAMAARRRHYPAHSIGGNS